MTNKFVFEDFPVYKTTLSFNSAISDLLEAIPDKNNYSIKDQLGRAAMSILLNIAEGAGRFTTADKRSFYVNARGSCYECVACLQILKIKQLLIAAKYDELYEVINDIARQLSALIKC